MFSIKAELSKNNPDAEKKLPEFPGRGIGGIKIKGVVKDVIHGR
ncbi:hypothetical protein [Methanosarcina sp.]|nr:hypothetical protein [Methanosarcina sp.]MDY9928067.1 hypothetical protein [Methanosarcina sp.]